MSEDVNLRSSDAHFAVILRRLDEIDKRMAEDREETKEFRKSLADQMSACSLRISSLETDKNRALAFAAGAGAAGGGMGAWFHKIFG